MVVLVEEAFAGRAELAVPVGVLAQAWRGGGDQARIARLLRASVTSVVQLDTRMAFRVGHCRDRPLAHAHPAKLTLQLVNQIEQKIFVA
jgi:hypothetical protein